MVRPLAALAEDPREDEQRPGPPPDRGEGGAADWLGKLTALARLPEPVPLSACLFTGSLPITGCKENPASWPSSRTCLSSPSAPCSRASASASASRPGWRRR